MDFSKWLSVRLQMQLPGKEAQAKMIPYKEDKRFVIPDEARKSSVLILFFPIQDDFHLVVIKRSRDGGIHSGQIAFPGGKLESYDSSAEAGALREAHEEINLNSEKVTLLGRLSPLYIPVSNFKVIPIVGFMPHPPKELQASEAEVAEILYFSFLKHFVQKTTRQVFSTTSKKSSLKVPAYQLNEQDFIWGATSMILSELETLWNEFRQQTTED